MTDVDRLPSDLADLRSPVRTVLLSIPDLQRREELADQLTGAGFRVLGSSSWTAGLDLLVDNSVDLGIVDTAIKDYDIYPLSHPQRSVAGASTGELPLIFLVDDPAEFDWDAYAQLDQAEIHTATGCDDQLVRQVCALATRLDRQAFDRVCAEQLRAAVRRVSATIRATTDPQRLADRLVEGLVEVFGVDLVSVGTFEDDRVPTLAVQWTRERGQLVPIDTTSDRPALQALAGRLWAAGTTLALSDHRAYTPTHGAEKLFARAGELGAGASVSVPIGDGDTAFGLLWMASKRTRVWSALETSLLQHLAGNVAHAMMQGQVITGQQEVLRRLERLDRAKSDFLATVNHELRTPLASLTAYLDLIQDGAGGPIPDQAAAMLNVVSRNANRLGAMIDDVLTVSRIAADDPQVDWAQVDLKGIAERVLVKLARASASADVDLVTDIASGVVVDGDATLLQQVVFQLVDNAIKFSRPGGKVVVGISERMAAGVPTVAITVTDTGIGIPADEVPALFTSFYRGAQSQVDATAGSGLGLTIVQGLVAAHGGHVSLAAADGGGTRVVVELPRRRRADWGVVDRLLPSAEPVQGLA